MSFPKYPEYKPVRLTGIEQLPTAWAVVPLKAVTSCNDDVLHESTPADFEIQYLEISGVDSVHGIVDVSSVSFCEAPSRARRKVKHGDVLVSTVRTYLRAIAPVINPSDNLIASTGFAIVRPRNIHPLFLSYMIRSEFVVGEIISRSVGVSYPAINPSELMKLQIPCPPVEEQSAIAAFLNRETPKIDALVAEQEKLIDLLKEKRQAVISHAVTKGLDPNVPMKDSGVEWLGEVPEHWTVGAIKNFYEFLDGKRIPLSGEERSSRSGEYPYYGASGVIDWIDDFIFDEDLVLVSEDGANLFCRSTPIAFVARGKYWVNNHAHILQPPDNALIYWAERIETIDLTPVLSGSAQPKLTSEALANIRIAIPPTYEERLDIQMFISQEAEGIDALVSQAQRAIDLLKERRSALISAAVTGKIDVRGLAEATQ